MQNVHRKTSGKLHVVRAAEVLYSSTHHESCVTGRHAASGQRVEQAFEKMLYRAGHGIKHLMTTILMDFYCWIGGMVSSSPCVYDVTEPGKCCVQNQSCACSSAGCGQGAHRRRLAERQLQSGTDIPTLTRSIATNVRKCLTLLFSKNSRRVKAS